MITRYITRSSYAPSVAQQGKARCLLIPTLCGGAQKSCALCTQRVKWNGERILRARGTGEIVILGTEEKETEKVRTRPVAMGLSTWLIDLEWEELYKRGHGMWRM